MSSNEALLCANVKKERGGCPPRKRGMNYESTYQKNENQVYRHSSES